KTAVDPSSRHGSVFVWRRRFPVGQWRSKSIHHHSRSTDMWFSRHQRAPVIFGDMGSLFTDSHVPGDWLVFHSCQRIFFTEMTANHCVQATPDCALLFILAR